MPTNSQVELLFKLEFASCWNTGVRVFVGFGDYITECESDTFFNRLTDSQGVPVDYCCVWNQHQFFAG